MTNRFRDEVKKSTGSGNAIITLSMFELRPRGRLQFVGETRSSRSKAGRIGGPPRERLWRVEMIKELSPFRLRPSFPSGGGADDVASEHRKILMGSPSRSTAVVQPVSRRTNNVSLA